MAKFVVVSLGGSLIVPHLSDEGGIDVAFLRKFRALIFGEIKRGRKFIVVAGGGKTARVYQKAGRQVGAPKDDLDWLGIAATKLNAHLLLSMLRAEAYSQVIDHKPSGKELQSIKKSMNSVYVVSGWYPGQSTDYEAVYLAREFGAQEVINASNIAFAYNKDPKRYRDAKPIRKISWREYRKLIPPKWAPGLSTPIDPVAARLAEKIGLRVKVLGGGDLKNFKKAIEGDKFKGTVIS